ncbi:N-acetylmuramoyl-L-alanine amidase, partial [Streptomyces sp. PKU-EA00015]|uniref:peptidoglycan recognition protein family protein n=1 Tax=Streptomyces sp. PKU-EA00015 TaxID=2748326 RepID=UPI00210BCB40
WPVSAASTCQAHQQPRRAPAQRADRLGFECINRGDGKDPWPAAQLKAIEKASAAICRAHGWSHRSVIGHLEWQPGKVDPRGFSMDSMQTRVKDRLTPPAPVPPAPAPTEETNVPANWNKATETDVDLTPGEWKTVAAGSVDLVTGAQSYTGSMHLTLTAPAGGTVQGRFFHLRPDGSRWTSPIVERITTSGGSFLDFPHAGSVEPTERVRFEAIYYPADDTDETPAPITSARLRGLYWK